VITLIVFAGFTAVYFKEPLSLTQRAGFALIAFGRDADVPRAGVREGCGKPPDQPRRPGGRKV
jgi:hypothetical protein